MIVSLDILSNKKKQCRDLAKTINLIKEEIDQTRQDIDKMRNDRAEHGKYILMNSLSPQMVILVDYAPYLDLAPMATSVDLCTIPYLSPNGDSSQPTHKMFCSKAEGLSMFIHYTPKVQCCFDCIS